MTAAAGAGEPARPAHDSVELPEASWQKLLPLASETLAATPPEQLPGPLRRFARFAPARRLKLAAAALRHALDNDTTFRQRVSEVAAEADPQACEAVTQGEAPGDDRFATAALAFLLRPDGWESMVDSARHEAEEQAQATRQRARISEAEQRATGAEHDRATAVREAEKLRVELTEARAEAADMRQRHREVNRELRETKRRERKLSDALSSEKGRRKQDEQRHTAEVKRLKTELDESLRSLERARRGARDARSFHESRVWLLLETIGDAAAGLRRELSQEPADRTPADFVAEHDGLGAAGQQARAERALEADDPARLDELLHLPHSHLIVDGYNVTIGGYREATLEQQRQRLVKGLSALAAQSGAEVTVVFDGADRMVGLPTPPRGVRVLFSRKGQTADEVIRALVRAEPDGRPVVVISTDREVADGVRRHGAYPLASTTLLRRLERG